MNSTLNTENHNMRQATALTTNITEGEARIQTHNTHTINFGTVTEIDDGDP